ncbi:MAG: cytochrome c-type biogenesis CcmF C-terminal domain-containing protein [Pseudomonadota bacterium]
MITVTLRDMQHKVRNAKTLRLGLARLSKSYYGMVCAHIGVAVTVLGTCLNTIYNDQRDLRMEVGETVAIGAYEYRFAALEEVNGPNYIAQRAYIEVFADGQKISELKPEKRRYFSTDDIMTEAAIDSSAFGDLFIAMGEALEPGESGAVAWAIRIHDKPFIPWIWLGSILMALGGFLAISDKRYRLKKAVRQKTASPKPQAVTASTQTVSH